MRQLQRSAIILSLVEEMRKRGSWCGETHIQKATFFLQEVVGIPFGFEFALYKHGPYSFDLSSAITAMRADQLLRLEPQPPYGPSLLPAEGAKVLKQLHAKEIKTYLRRVQFVAERLGPARVVELERLGTALFITRKGNGDDSIGGRAHRIHDLKPHISFEEAKEAVIQVDEIVKDGEKVIRQTD